LLPQTHPAAAAGKLPPSFLRLESADELRLFIAAIHTNEVKQSFIAINGSRECPHQKKEFIT
jgi:hypothetical protein